ncbi:MAG TPA: ABC transporter substrate-binding protein [Candidatus Cryosericum sp.]|nr:ABC transporter substrate-binding protein [Candidatus Cryosericum sp.]
MNFKKLLAVLSAILLVVSLVAACAPKTTEEPAAATEEATVEATEAPAEEAAPVSAVPDWAPYDALIAQIKTTTDFAERVTLMHQAEDMLMATGAVCPIYHYNDLFMQKAAVEGIYSNAYGFKFFQYATNGDSDTLSVNISSEPENLDPALNTTVDGCILALLQFGGLYSDSANGMVANFADGMPTISEDGMTYTIKVKDGLKWSDGSDLTAADFEYAWRRAAGTETAAEYSYMFSAIDGYPDNLNVTVDGNTITVVLGAPCAYFLDLLAFPTYFPLKQSAVEGAEGYKDASGAIVAPNAWCREAGFVSCGAFTLTEWNHESSMVFTKNPYYWDAANVKLNTIKFMLSADDVAIFAAYNAGDVDFIDTVPTDEIKNLKSNPEFHIIDNLGTYYVCFNVNSDLYDGMTVDQAAGLRKAIASAIDRQYIVDTVAQCEQKVATSWVGYGVKDGNGGLFKDGAAWTYPNGTDGYYNDADIDSALQILTDAGFEIVDGKLATPIEVEYLINESTTHQGVAECVQQDLAAIGITITIHTVDWATFVNERQAGNFDVCRHGWLCDFNDPINMLELFTSTSGNNDCQLGK